VSQRFRLGAVAQTIMTKNCPVSNRRRIDGPCRAQLGDTLGIVRAGRLVAVPPSCLLLMCQALRLPDLWRATRLIRVYKIFPELFVCAG